MSIKIMSLVFESETLGATERLVLLALADHANDDGVCYPSTGRLCQRTGLKERAVQGHIKTLVAGGYLTIEPNAGPRGANVFHIHMTPAESAPPQNLRPRRKQQYPPQKTTVPPAESADEPSNNHQEPSKGVREILLSVLSAEVADAYIEHRKAKRSKITVRAAELIAKKLSDHPSPNAVVERSIENGWTGVFPDQVQAATTRRTFTAPAATTGAHIPSAAIERTAPPPEDMSRFQRKGQ